MAQMRLFFGVPLPPAASIALEAVMQQVPLQRGWHPVAARNWHVTLSFLGDTDGRLLNPLIELGERVAAAHTSTAIVLDSLQLWPTALHCEKRPRLLAAVASVSTALQPLRKDINAGLRELGVAYDGKPLRAHVTLLRLERDVLIDDLRVPACCAEIAVEQLALFVSEGGGRDKYYRPLWQQALQQPPPWGWRKQ
jgi:2'-5' RNA ligase